MRKKGFLFLLLCVFVTIGVADGAGRSGLNTSRTNGTHQQSARTTNAITTKTRGDTSRSGTIVNRTKNTAQKSSRSGLTLSKRTTQTTPSNKKQVVGRVATTLTTEANAIKNFGVEYENCHDAYFTCMDQFCATLDETYRRCICSSRLTEIQKKQSSLSVAADSVTGFHDLNLDVVNKSGDEVRAMMSATVGEQTAANTHDRSDSAQQLNAISDVLSTRRSAPSKATGGIMDIGGDINSIWSTTDIASGADIATLTGPALYNAVHAQCTKMVQATCPSNLLNMVTSAYGMYIESDCTALASDLSKKKNTANSTIRETGRELGAARLENYNAHNSLSINDCIANIRQDLTANTACGTDYVHCLDITGLYLNIDTGAPIYSPIFFNLENQTSLSGNILENKTNSQFVQMLNKKKIFAQNSLDECRDLSASIWDEYMRQAIIEIHQNQQEKIREVKTECLGVVNECYDTQTQQLADFTNVDEKSLLALRLAATEDMCRKKLDTCSNLYGGGPDGLVALVNAMHDIVDEKILAECQNALTDFTQSICAVRSTDTSHTYPYGCRTYIPGDQKYAKIPECNSGVIDTITCGDYAGSLYQRMANYAMQVCVRPSMAFDNEIPTLVLQDINMVMDKVRIAMNQALSTECENYGGVWIAIPYNDTSIALQTQFYTDTNSNKKWGYCKNDPVEATRTYVVRFDNSGLQEASNGVPDVNCVCNGNCPEANTIADIGECTLNENALTSINMQYGTVSSQVIPTPAYSNTITLNGTETTCQCQHFCGYYSQPNCAGIKYYRGGYAIRQWDIEGDATLYACWQTYDTDCP